jgi:hypothetical protein
VNGETAQASSTNLKIGVASIENYPTTPVSLYNVKPQGPANAAPMNVINAVQAIATGSTAHNQPVGGNPVRGGGKVVVTQAAAFANGVACDASMTSSGQLIQKEFASAEIASPDHEFIILDVAQTLIAKDDINKNQLVTILNENKSIQEINGLKKFIETNDENLAGGKSLHSKKYKLDDSESSSSSSDSDDDYYYYYKPVNRSLPITYWSYYPYVYNLRKFYVPTFVPTISPYVYISLSNE